MNTVLKEMLTELRGLDLGLREYSLQATCLVRTFMKEDVSDFEISKKHYEIMGEKL